MTRSRLFAVLVALVPLAPAHAQIFKCEGPNGVVEYSNAQPAAQPGRTCRSIEVGTITVVPAPKPQPRPQPPVQGTASPQGPASAQGARPEGFPRVDPSTQRARDDERRRILEDEVAKEEARLVELRREYNNGEPERLGSERNYQKYLDRVQRLKDDIARSEANLITLRRELSGGRP
jgi:hypothetical protein